MEGNGDCFGNLSVDVCTGDGVIVSTQSRESFDIFGCFMRLGWERSCLS